MKFSCHERMWEEDHIIGRVAASYTTCMCFSPHLNFRLYVYNCIFNLFSHGMYMSYKKKENEMIEILMDLTVTMRGYQIIDN